MFGLVIMSTMMCACIWIAHADKILSDCACAADSDAGSMMRLDNMVESVCLQNICWNAPNASVNEQQIENELWELVNTHRQNEIKLFDQQFLKSFDEYDLGLIIYNWWYIASMVGQYLGVATSHAIAVNDTLLAQLLTHNYNEEMGYLSSDPKRKHSRLLRDSLNAVLRVIGLPEIRYEDISLHYLPSHIRDIYLVVESYELRNGIYHMFGGNEQESKNVDFSKLIGCLIYIELQAHDSEIWLWKVLTESSIIKDRLTQDSIKNEISPYFEAHLELNQDNVEPDLGAEETHALHALIMAKKQCLIDSTNCFKVKNSFLLERDLELNVFVAILNAIQRKSKSFRFLNQSVYNF